MTSEAWNGDCMEYMARFPDGFFDLAIVDPPYGDGGGGQWDKAKNGRFGGHFTKYKIESHKDTKNGRNSDIRHWDTAPGENYFSELFRMSKNAIIWGGNYFGLPPNRNFIIWRKLKMSEKFSMAMAEYAWTNIPGNAIGRGLL